jgi:release factor H-coupled RctB family protein
MEGDALRQLAQVADMPDCCAAVGMPDLHAGPGIPIGAALAFNHSVHPHLVGSDAGCGARALAIGKLKIRGDALERRAREVFAEPTFGTLLDPALDEQHLLLEAVWQRGIQAFTEFPGKIDGELADHAADTLTTDPEPPWLRPSVALPEFLTDRPHSANFARSLGTIGGGNHFVELGAVARIFDDTTASDLGVQRRGHVILAHSGSRGLGKALADHWGHVALTDPDEQQRYLGQLAGAIRFARANRLLLCWRMAQACGVARSGRALGGFDLVHNFVAHEPITAGESDPPAHAWVHRKGCAPAFSGEPTVILGSRGAPSWIMRGQGCHACLCSVAHGAGRRMTRSEARAKIATRHTRASLTRTRSGGRVICENKDLLYEEHPDAYKAIDPVIDSLEVAGAATRVAELNPLLTVKL